MISDELMRGNLVLIDGVTLAEVREIREFQAKVLYQGEINAHIGNRFSLVACERLKPVDITSDWMLKFEFFEFEASSEYRYFEKNGVYVNIKKNGEYFSVIYQGHYIEFEDYYIHNLQNLYHSVNQEKLTVNIENQ